MGTGNYIWPHAPPGERSGGGWRWGWELPRPDRYGTRPLYFRDYIESHYWDAIINGTQGKYNGDVPRSSGLFYGWRGLYSGNIPEETTKLVTNVMRAYVFSYLELHFAHTRLFTYDIGRFDLRFRAWLMEWDIPFWRMIAALGFPFFNNMLYNNTASMDSSMARSGTNQFSNSTGTNEQKQHEAGGARDGQSLFLNSANSSEDLTYGDTKRVTESSGAATGVLQKQYGHSVNSERLTHFVQLNPTVTQAIASIFPQSAITVGIGAADQSYVDPNFGSTLLSNSQMPKTNLVYAQSMEGQWSLPGATDTRGVPILDKTGSTSFSSPTATREQQSSDNNNQVMSVNQLSNKAYQESLTNGITAAFSDRQDASLSKAIQSLINDSANMVIRRGSAPNMSRMYELQRSYELARDQRPFTMLAQSFVHDLAYKRYDARHEVYPTYADRVDIPIYNKDTGGF